MTDKIKIETVCEECFELSLQQVTYTFGVDSQTIVEIIDEGIIHLKSDHQGHWQFDSEAIQSIRTVLRLQQDLGINIAGAALALELLREIEQLHALIEDKSSPVKKP